MSKIAASFKLQVYEQCRQIVGDKLETLRQSLRDLSDSAANETKSSAGDKYETGRAMLHIEQDGVRQQIAVVAAQQALLNTLDPAIQATRIRLGSLADIGGAWYYLSAGLGKIQIDTQRVIALSLQSPLGSRMSGLATGDELTMNGKKLMVGEVL